VVTTGERSNKPGSWCRNRFPVIIIEDQDSVSASKQHGTLRILDYRKYLAHLTIVVSRESTKKRMPKFLIGSEEDAGAANQENKSEKKLNHLENS
jgi:hypothetical protein